MTTDEAKVAICNRIAAGESLRAICASDDMPGKSTVFEWLAADDEFRQRYASARELQADTYADEIVNIADTPLMGEKTVIKADGSVETTKSDMIEHRRLQVDARKWVASKLRPKKYGDATLLKHADPEGERLELDGVERAVRLAAIFADVEKRKAGQ